MRDAAIWADLKNSPMSYALSLWPLVLITPLIRVPAPSIVSGLPWKPELFLSLYLAVCILFAFKHGKKDRVVACPAPVGTSILPIVMLAFTGWSALSLLWADSMSSGLHHTLLWAAYFIFFLVLIWRKDDKDFVWTSLCVLGAVVFIIAVNCVLEYTLRESIDQTFGFRYGRYTEVFAALLPLFAAIVLRSSGYARLLAAGVAGLTWLAILFSTSRTSLAAAIVGLAVFTVLLILKMGMSPELKKVGVIAACLLLLGLLTQLPGLVRPSENRSTTIGRFAISTDQNSANSIAGNIRFMIGTVGFEMWERNQLIGVGADNFGIEFAEYRALVSADANNRPLVIKNEDAIPERAHNEYLQVLAELGIVGGIIFLGFLLAVVFLGLRAVRQADLSAPDSIFTLAAIAGITAFLFSSMFSSFSFRLAQNGVVFFFLLAIMVRNLTSSEPQGSKQPAWKKRLPILTVGLLCCAGLAMWSSTKAVSQYLAYRGENIGDVESAKQDFETAITLDPANASPHYSFAMMLYGNARYSDAAAQFREMTRKGINTSSTYSYWISAHSLADQHTAALDAAREATAVYPYSVFLLTRYSVLLQNAGNTVDAETQFNKAREIDARQAQTWRLVITQGSRKAAEAGRAGVGIPFVADLYPTDALYAMLSERHIRYPEERFGFPE